MDRSNLDRFYVENSGLIHTVARKGYGRLQAIGSGMEYDDLVQDLTVVFIKSYDKFDEASGNRFSTYFMAAAFNRINRIAGEQEIERVENGVRSMEEMSERFEDDTSIEEVIASDAATPEQIVEAASIAQGVLSKLSPLAAKIAEMAIDPPDFIEREFMAAQAHAEISRNKGIEKRASRSLNVSFVCSVLEKTTDLPVLSIREARKQILATVERSIKQS